jgi:hypothetical protein
MITQVIESMDTLLAGKLNESDEAIIVASCIILQVSSIHNSTRAGLERETRAR